ncbi:MAG: glycosyltransferase family 39 protein [Cyanobacteria bacterium J06649_4]
MRRAPYPSGSGDRVAWACDRLQDRSSQRAIAYIAISALCLLICFRFAYLHSDFPTDLGATGMAYTDEGWWSRNAVSLVREGRWYIDDGYNTVSNLPVLPMMQAVWFKLFGVGLTSARALSVICSLLVSALVYGFARREFSPSLAVLAPLVVLSSYPVYAYSRMALLEMPMILLIMLSLWIVTTYQLNALPRLIVSGLFLALAILTKTTALFALPVIVGVIILKPEPIQQRQEEREGLRRSIRLTLIWLLALGVFLGFYYGFVQNIMDSQSQAYFENYNISAKVHSSIFSILKGPLRVVERSLRIFPLLFPALLTAIGTLFLARQYRSSQLFRLVWLWTAATLGMFSLSNFAAPRYFLVLIVPAALVTPLVVSSFVSVPKNQTDGGSAADGKSRNRLLVWGSALFISILLFSTSISLVRIGAYVHTPNFTLVNAAEDIDGYITSDPDHSNVVMGHFADTVALASDHAKAINDEMGFRSLAYRVEQLNPGYYLSIGEVEDDVRRLLQNRYQLQQIEQYNIYQNRDYGQPVFLYRLILLSVDS